MKYKLSAAYCVVGTVCLSPAYAYDLGNVKINGFGQVVVGSTLDNNRPYVTTANPIYTYDADPKFDQESLFALQVSAPLTDKITATAQIVSHGSDNFDTEFEWAYVNYQFNSDWSVKIGRQRGPLFYFSDYLEVGVAYPWMRPPTAVYSVVGTLSNFDGATVNYSHNFGKWELDPQFIYGRNSATVTLDGAQASNDDRNLVGGVIRANYNDWLSLRAAFFQTQVTLTGSPIDALVTGLQQAGFNQAATDIAVNGDTGTFGELGTEIDYAKWQFISEFVEVRSYHNFIAHEHDYYVALGRHFGKFLPMFTYGRQNASAPGQPLNEIPNIPEAVAAVTAVLDSGLARDNYYQFDLRYDLANNVALKADYTAFNSSIPGKTSTNLVSAGVAFSF